MFYVEKRGANVSATVPIETELFCDMRQVYLEGEITRESIGVVCKQLMYLIKQDSRKPIFLFINSPGGEVQAGFCLIDFLRSLPPEIPVYEIVTQSAYSMAALIFTAGQLERRWLFKNASLMIHRPVYSGEITGNKTDMNVLANNINILHQKTVELLKESTGQAVNEIEKALQKDSYFDAKSSIEWGLADRIVGVENILLSVMKET